MRSARDETHRALSQRSGRAEQTVAEGRRRQGCPTLAICRAKRASSSQSVALVARLVVPTILLLACRNESLQRDERPPSARNDELVWRLPDGHGGVNELCRDSACVPWLEDLTRGRVFTGDFNGDKALDVARCTSLTKFGAIKRIEVRVGRDGHFVSARGVDISDGRGAAVVAAFGDIDGDERDDLVSVVSPKPPDDGSTPKVLPPPLPPRIVLIHGDRLGLVAPVALVDLADWAPEPRIATGDVNGDGRRDLVMVGLGANESSRIAIYPGKPGGLDTKASYTKVIKATPHQIGLLDIDKDGVTDMVFVGVNSIPGSMGLWRGGPSGLTPARATWAAPPGDQVGFGRALAVGTFSAGASAEVAIADPIRHQVFIYHANTRHPTRVIESGPRPLEGMAATDLDADGLDELVVVKINEIQIYSNSQLSPQYRINIK